MYCTCTRTHAHACTCIHVCTYKYTWKHVKYNTCTCIHIASEMAHPLVGLCMLWAFLIVILISGMEQLPGVLWGEEGKDGVIT